ncbi:MAG: chemotaxis-specific protein-glutamate methyltransferase CheB [Polyangiaceae bacterium]
MIRVLIAEDSATTLELLSTMLESDPEIRVVGRAKNGAEAVALTKTVRPDVVVMDIHMPVLDGFRATRQIMIESPTPIVIVSATLDVKAVDVSLHALRLGALSVLEKPVGPGAVDFPETCERFIATIRAMSGVKVVRRWAESSAPPTELASEQRSPPQLIAIAASTGGPTALLRVLSDLPPTLSVPVLIVQHMAPGFVSGLASWLAEGCSLKVKVAEGGAHLEAGVAYLAPDDRHLGLSDRRTLLVSSTPPCGGFRPSGTYLFESVARVYGSSAVGVILTGMGDDGCTGLGAVRRAGGRIIAQDEATSVVFGMPAAAITAGLPDIILPLDLIGPRLQAWLGSPPALQGRKVST